MMSDLISVIVPVYNLENYIVRTLDSILSQTYKNIEVIVVDDGSTDSSAKIIDDYADLHRDVIKILHIKNSGVSVARMKGVLAAKGDWIGFTDGDDVIEPDMYERLFDNAQKYNADISHCGYQMVSFKLTLMLSRIIFFTFIGSNIKFLFNFCLDAEVIRTI